MKRLFYLSLFFSIFLVSCELSPVASFYVDTFEPVVGQEVHFTNSSDNAESFEWDFGDNTFTDEPSPVHVYTGTGTYEVTLTAVSRTGIEDKAYATITVKIPTLLEVEVLEYYQEYPVDDASILIFPTLADWEDGSISLSIAEAITNEDGIAVFTDLGPYVYYLDVWEANHNNYALKEEDINFIRTPQIRPNEINRFTAYVDYVGTKSADGKRDRSVVVRKLVPRVYKEKDDTLTTRQVH